VQLSQEVILLQQQEQVEQVEQQVFQDVRQLIVVVAVEEGIIPLQVQVQQDQEVVVLVELIVHQEQLEL
tara:strand:+ start:524 stop:730 length:207 start_codon:yes stop_codon:yes gene_type:complete